MGHGTINRPRTFIHINIRAGNIYLFHFFNCIVKHNLTRVITGDEDIRSIFRQEYILRHHIGVICLLNKLNNHRLSAILTGHNIIIPFLLNVPLRRHSRYLLLNISLAQTAFLILRKQNTILGFPQMKLLSAHIHKIAAFTILLHRSSLSFGL